MSLPWPTFWSDVPEDDRPAIKEAVAELLSTGVLLGDEGRARELYLVAREYQRQIAEYLAVVELDLVPDPDRPIFQARPTAGECALIATFSKDETLLVLVLWRIYDEERMARPTQSVVFTANHLYARLKLYFEHIEQPTETHLERMLAKLRRKKLIRFHRHEDPQLFGESGIEILPTLPRVIPFEDATAWEQQVAIYQQAQAPDPAP